MSLDSGTRADSTTLVLHHVATAALIYGSMMNGYMQFGLLVLFVHDVSDIPLDFMLMSNMLKRGNSLVSSCLTLHTPCG